MAKKKEKKGLLDKVVEAVTGSEEVVEETVVEEVADDIVTEAVATEADADALYSVEEAAEINELKRRGFNPKKAQQVVEAKREGSEPAE